MTTVEWFQPGIAGSNLELSNELCNRFEFRPLPPDFSFLAVFACFLRARVAASVPSCVTSGLSVLATNGCSSACDNWGPSTHPDAWKRLSLRS